MNKVYSTCIFLLAGFLLPLLTMAHGYWFEVKGSGKVNEPVKVQICFGEIDENGVRIREQGDRIAQIAGFKVFVVNSKGQQTEIVLHRSADRWEGVLPLLKKMFIRYWGSMINCLF